MSTLKTQRSSTSPEATLATTSTNLWRVPSSSQSVVACTQGNSTAASEPAGAAVSRPRDLTKRPTHRPAGAARPTRSPAGRGGWTPARSRRGRCASQTTPAGTGRAGTGYCVGCSADEDTAREERGACEAVQHLPPVCHREMHTPVHCQTWGDTAGQDGGMTRVRPAVDGPKNSVTMAVLPRSVTAVVVDVAIQLLLPCSTPLAAHGARLTGKLSARDANPQTDRRREASLWSDWSGIALQSIDHLRACVHWRLILSRGASL